MVDQKPSSYRQPLLTSSGDIIDRCPECTRKVQQGWRVCPYCRGSLRGAGAELARNPRDRPIPVRFCAHCGAESPAAGDKYCQSCGSPIGAVPTREEAQPIPPPPNPHTSRQPTSRRSGVPLLLTVVLLLAFFSGSVVLLAAIAPGSAGDTLAPVTPAATKLIVTVSPTTVSPTPADPDVVTGSLSYVLRGGPSGGQGVIPFQVHRSAYQAVAGENPPFYGDERQYYQQVLDNPVQRSDLAALAEEIRSITDDPDDQARIAISAVQHIPYDTAKAELDSSEWRERYPLEVLYDNQGLCGEKSLLLASLLRDLGFGVVLFDFKTEQHMAVGIRCPAGYDFAGTGYAFVESTEPSIMTDSSENYAGVGKLTYMPKVIPVASGAAFSSISEEAADTKEWQALQNMGKVLDEYHYAQYDMLKKKYGMVTNNG